MTVPAHTHRCATCDHEWQCFFVNAAKARVCGVLVAASVNKAGPLCLLCMHLEMAQAAASLRGLMLTTELSPIHQGPA